MRIRIIAMGSGPEAAKLDLPTHVSEFYVNKAELRGTTIFIYPGAEIDLGSLSF